MTIRTYVFGNPSGWTLYEGDEAENDYFKDFYVASRHGDRLTVNRRTDGTVAYTYINYDLRESSDRCGPAHFGMSMIMDGGEYTPDFAALYSFMQQLFNAAVNRSDGLFTSSDGRGVRYGVSKLSDAADTIEWIKATLPKIFDRVKTAAINNDSSFAKGSVGNVLTLPDDVEPTTALAAFRKCRWVAVSSQFRPPEKEGGGDVLPPEISLRDIELQHKSIMQRVLDIAVDANTNPSVKRELREKIDQINEARSLLAGFITASTDAEETDRAKADLKDYGRLRDRIDDLLKRDVAGQHHDHDHERVYKPHDDYEQKNDSVKKKIIDSEIPLYQWIIGAVVVAAVIIFIIIAIIKSFNKPDVPDRQQEEDTTEAVEDKIIENVQEEPTLSAEEIEATLWNFVISDDLTNLSFYFDNHYDELNKSGFVDEKQNGREQWTSYLKLYTKLNEIIKGKDWKTDRVRYAECMRIIDALPLFAQSELREAVEKRQAQCDEHARQQALEQQAQLQQPVQQGDAGTSGGALTVTCAGKSKTAKSLNEGIGFTVEANKEVKVESTLRLRYDPNPQIEAVPNPKRTKWTLKFKKKGKYIFTTQAGHKITFTVK